MPAPSLQTSVKPIPIFNTAGNSCGSYRRGVMPTSWSRAPFGSGNRTAGLSPGPHDARVEPGHHEVRAVPHNTRLLSFTFSASR